MNPQNSRPALQDRHCAERAQDPSLWGGHTSFVPFICWSSGENQSLLSLGNERGCQHPCDYVSGWQPWVGEWAQKREIPSSLTALRIGPR